MRCFLPHLNSQLFPRIGRIELESDRRTGTREFAYSLPPIFEIIVLRNHLQDLKMVLFAYKRSDCKGMECSLHGAQIPQMIIRVANPEPSHAVASRHQGSVLQEDEAGTEFAAFTKSASPPAQQPPVSSKRDLEDWNVEDL